MLALFWRGEAAVPSPCDIMVRREIIDSVGGFEEAWSPSIAENNLCDDQVFYTKVCLRAPVFVSDQCWDRYRQHPESACAVAAKTGLDHSGQLTFLKWIEAYLHYINKESKTL